MALCLCFAAVTVSADVVWSSAFDFDGSEIVEPVVIPKVNQIGYSMALSSGTVNKELGVIAYPEGGLDGREIFFTDDPNDEGTFSWNYINNPIFVENSNYTLKETIIASDAPDVTYTRVVHILPEPVALLILGLVGAMFLRRHAKSLLIVLALVSLGSIGVNATTISVGKCFQMWPFERKVIINYTVSDCSGEEYINFYYTTDNGESSYNLRDNGILTGDVGPISANGNYRVIWTPDTETMTTVKGKMKIGVDVYEPEPPTPSTYMVVDLNNNYEISYLDAEPSGGWPDAYKTTKMVFRYIQADSFTMGSPTTEDGRTGSKEIPHNVELTKSFYIGVFEVTQKQYQLITGNTPSMYSGDMRPVEQVSYDMIRGSSAGAGWPTTKGIDNNSFLYTFRNATGKLFDLPTEAQWEYACRATTGTSLNNGTDVQYPWDGIDDPHVDVVARNWYNTQDGHYTDQPYYYRQHTVVGCYEPNQWGLYDMHGNVREWCLDWYTANISTYVGPDPEGPSSSSDGRVVRGGCFQDELSELRSAARNFSSSNSTGGGGVTSIGFRLVVEVE